MWPFDSIGSDPFIDQAIRTVLLMIVATVLGWSAARIFDPGIRARGTTLLAGLLGLTGGTWMAAQTGWNGGPVLMGYALLPSFMATITTCGIVKLLTFSVAGSR